MKKILFTILFINLISTAFAQNNDPEKWTFEKEKNTNGTYDILFKVVLQPEWHIYSQFTDEGGPLPTVFIFSDSACYTKIGKVTEPVPHQDFDSIFMVSVKTFDKEVVFRQTVKPETSDCIVKGSIEYQICKEMCIFKTTTFSVPLKDQ